MFSLLYADIRGVYRHRSIADGRRLCFVYYILLSFRTTKKLRKRGVYLEKSETNYAIEMLNITKKFPGIIANDNITLQLKKGEIHALLGENGAGKSTLMSVLFGLYQPEEGVIKKDGKVVEIKDPNDANALGIGMVHQHF